MIDRGARGWVDDILQLRGAGRQGACRNGDPDCPGRHGPGAPCFECLIEGGAADGE
jgi:hypothetical protein